MVNRLLILISFVLSAVLLAMMNFTTPTDAGPLGVLLFFTTLYVILFTVAAGLVAIFFRIKKRSKLGVKGYAFAGVIALAPIILLVMRPFIGFSIGAVAAAVVFEVIGCFLISKMQE